jgi:hypothetical protein
MPNGPPSAEHRIDHNPLSQYFSSQIAASTIGGSNRATATNTPVRRLNSASATLPGDTAPVQLLGRWSWSRC